MLVSDLYVLQKQKSRVDFVKVFGPYVLRPLRMQVKASRISRLMSEH